ncbi:MAG: CsbD family protein [Litorilinea sp.]
MNNDMLKGKWNQIKGGVKSQWGELTDDDLTQAEGEYEKLVGKIQERYGYEREQAEREVNDFMHRMSR